MIEIKTNCSIEIKTNICIKLIAKRKTMIIN